MTLTVLPTFLIFDSSPKRFQIYKNNSAIHCSTQLVSLVYLLMALPHIQHQYDYLVIYIWLNIWFQNGSSFTYLAFHSSCSEAWIKKTVLSLEVQRFQCQNQWFCRNTYTIQLSHFLSPVAAWNVFQHHGQLTELGGGGLRLLWEIDARNSHILNNSPCTQQSLHPWEC